MRVTAVKASGLHCTAASHPMRIDAGQLLETQIGHSYTKSRQLPHSQELKPGPIIGKIERKSKIFHFPRGALQNKSQNQKVNWGWLTTENHYGGGVRLR